VNRSTKAHIDEGAAVIAATVGVSAAGDHAAKSTVLTAGVGLASGNGGRSSSRSDAKRMKLALWHARCNL
jgi:hypothetical protein